MISFGVGYNGRDKAEIENSDLGKQIIAKGNVLHTITKNIDENIRVIKDCPSNHVVKVGERIKLPYAFKGHYEETKEAEEIARGGMPDLVKLTTVKKPEKKRRNCLWVALAGIAQIVVGGLV